MDLKTLQDSDKETDKKLPKPYKKPIKSEFSYKFIYPLPALPSSSNEPATGIFDSHGTPVWQKPQP